MAVLLDEPEHYLDVSFAVADALESACGVRGIEVLVMDDAPLRLRGRLLQQREVLHSRDEPARVAYESLTMREFYDFEPYAWRTDREMLRRIAAGSADGRPDETSVATRPRRRGAARARAARCPDR